MDFIQAIFKKKVCYVVQFDFVNLGPLSVIVSQGFLVHVSLSNYGDLEFRHNFIVIWGLGFLESFANMIDIYGFRLRFLDLY